MTGSTQGRVDFTRVTIWDGAAPKDIVVRFNRQITLQTVGTGSVTWQATIDGTNWEPVQAKRLSSGVSAQTATAAGLYQLDCTGFDKFRGDTVSGFTSIIAASTS